MPFSCSRRLGSHVWLQFDCLLWSFTYTQLSTWHLCLSISFSFHSLNFSYTGLFHVFIPTSALMHNAVLSEKRKSEFLGIARSFSSFSCQLNFGFLKAILVCLICTGIHFHTAVFLQRTVFVSFLALKNLINLYSFLPLLYNIYSPIII